METNIVIAYYIENMASKEFICKLFKKYGIRHKEDLSYSKYKEIYLEHEDKICYREFVDMCRNEWVSSPIEYHKANLSSGALIGHSWHKATPSRLHMSLQDKVRECIAEKDAIENLFKIAEDIMKHEYFMTATHDICESLIIRCGAVPPSRYRSVSDFLYNNIPYDLKVSTYPENCQTKPCRSYEDKVELIKLLVNGADNLRNRRQAANLAYGWGDNRFYILVADQNRWISDTDALVDEITTKVSSLDEPISVDVGEESILVQMIEV